MAVPFSADASSGLGVLSAFPTTTSISRRLRIAYSPDLGVFPAADAVEAVVRDAVGDLADATAGTVERVDVDFRMELLELVEPKYHRGGPVHTAGQTSEGLPVGLQIATPRFAADLVLSASAALESTRPWADTYRTL